MKVFTVTGSDGSDYGAMMFDDNTPLDKYASIWEKANKKGRGILKYNVRADGDDQTVDIIAYEFGEVDPKFVDFIRSETDYDHSKHRNFFVV